MDFELRNLKDFLTLYNSVTELCFNACVDNLFSRDLSGEEIRCTENCVGKFTNVNQRLLQVYVGAQGEINQRRMVEFEAQQAKLAEAQQQELAKQQQEQSQLVAEAGSSGGVDIASVAGGVSAASDAGASGKLEAVAN